MKLTKTLFTTKTMEITSQKRNLRQGNVNQMKYYTNGFWMIAWQISSKRIINAMEDKQDLSTPMQRLMQPLQEVKTYQRLYLEDSLDIILEAIEFRKEHGIRHGSIPTDKAFITLVTNQSGVNPYYAAYFLAYCKNPEFYQQGTYTPVYVIDDEKIMGMIKPVRL